MSLKSFSYFETPIKSLSGGNQQKVIIARWLLKNSDIISLHCPLTRENKYLIDEASINKMKKGVYIINTSSGKFHLDGCDGAYNMSSKNKRVFEGSRQVLIDQGYEQCGNCRP